MQTQPFCHYLVAYSNIMQSECTILPYHTDRYYRIVPTDIIVSHTPILPYRIAPNYAGVLHPITLGCCVPLHWGAAPHYAGVLRPITLGYCAPLRWGTAPHSGLDTGKAAHMLKNRIRTSDFSYNFLKFPLAPSPPYSIYTFSSALCLLHFVSLSF